MKGREGWRAMFPNEKREFLAGCTEDRMASQQAAEKGSPLTCPFLQSSLMCSLPALPSVQPAENSCFSFGNRAFQPAWPSV